MVKRTLIAIALVAFLASTAPAALEVYYWGPLSGNYLDKEAGVKVDGNIDDVYWPFEYKALDICSMPLKMEVGMYVDVQNCKDRKIVLKQVDCGDIGKGANEFPCYHDCENINIRANFEVKLGTRIEKVGGVLDQVEGYYDGGDIIPGDGSYHTATVCVRAWKARLYNQSAGAEVTVGTLYITAKPNILPEFNYQDR